MRKLSLYTYKDGAIKPYRPIVNPAGTSKPQLQKLAIKSFYYRELSAWIHTQFKGDLSKVNARYRERYEQIKNARPLKSNVAKFIDRQEIAKLTGLTYSQVRNSINLLRSAGAIKTKLMYNENYKGYYIRF